MPKRLDPPVYKNLAYVSEPITRCPPREKGRIRNLVEKMGKALADPPFHTRLYIPSLVTSPEVRDTMTAEHVYLLDRIRVVESNFMLVCADHTSFGIGGEVEMATSLGKPIIIFSREETLSRFLVGTPSNAVKAHLGKYYIQYREWRDLKPQIFEMVEKVLTELENATSSSGIPFTDVGKQLRKWRTKRKMSIEELADTTGLRPEHLTLLEKPFDTIREELAEYEDSDIDLGKIDFTQQQIEELSNIGLPALHKLAVALEVTLGTLLGETGGVGGASKVAQTQRRRVREIREENLQRRAAQFDITFRQYEALHKMLVDDILDQFAGTARERSRSLQIIGEKEFVDALAAIRNTRLR
ncbi:MAG: helix-turn-helix transcriptional regulator [Acidobacteriota bacterium]|nr:helix-turn-helix transcriptional regulator [Acidobacteriota bacterium]